MGTNESNDTAQRDAAIVDRLYSIFSMVQSHRRNNFMDPQRCMDVALTVLKLSQSSGAALSPSTSPLAERANERVSPLERNQDPKEAVTLLLYNRNRGKGLVRVLQQGEQGLVESPYMQFHESLVGFGLDDRDRL